MTQEKNEAQIPRRNFIRRIWFALGIIASLEIIYILFKFLGSGKKRETPSLSEYIDTGSPESFKVGSITSFSSRKFFLVRMSENEFLALSTRCTHLGCSLICDEKNHKIICPCHSSSFDKAGRVLRSPATRDLDLHEVKIENGIVKVNTGVIVPRPAKYR